MLVLGVHAFTHDSAAVVLRDGEVIAAVEEERLNRVKHTNAFPRRAIAACLKQARARLRDVELVAVNHSEESLARLVAQRVSSQNPTSALSARALVVEKFYAAGMEIDPAKLRFVAHHLAHAASAACFSGFDKALVLSIDGEGEDPEIGRSSGLLAKAEGSSLECLRKMAWDESLGLMYGQITKLLGFREFDEYKLMGLAPYGRRDRYRRAFSDSYELCADGWYRIDRHGLLDRLQKIIGGTTRRNVEGVRKDIAAGCQEALETIVLHLLRWHAEQHALVRLAMAGGVALNCALNGKIVASNMFEDVFVQPAAHDAGGALGAAIYVSNQARRRSRPGPRLRSVYWGAPIPSSRKIEQALAGWSKLITWTRPDDIVSHAAQHLANGDILAWVQSRSEFGPRALGNRSILADPRPARNKKLINAMIKERESFRPFAPSVLEEKAGDYFEAGNGCGSSPFMLLLQSVRPEHRETLAAVTHVDGTARVQTVSRHENEKYWRLIRAFGDLTGVYVLLNTSFNNSAEPIVDSVEDAIVAYLTTGLRYLVVDDLWITKRELTDDLILDCKLTVAACTEFGLTGTAAHATSWVRYRDEAAPRSPLAIGYRTLEALCGADDRTTVRELLDWETRKTGRAEALGEIRRLWWNRFIELAPVDSGRKRRA